MQDVNRSTLKIAGLTAIVVVLALVLPLSLVLRNQTDAVVGQTWVVEANSQQTAFVVRYHNAFAKSGLQPEDDQKLWPVVTSSLGCMEQNTTSDATPCVTSAVTAAEKKAASPAKQEAYAQVIRDSTRYLNADALNPDTRQNKELLSSFRWHWAFNRPGSIPIAN